MEAKLPELFETPSNLERPLYRASGAQATIVVPELHRCGNVVEDRATFAM